MSEHYPIVDRAAGLVREALGQVTGGAPIGYHVTMASISSPVDGQPIPALHFLLVMPGEVAGQQVMSNFTSPDLCPPLVDIANAVAQSLMSMAERAQPSAGSIGR